VKALVCKELGLADKLELVNDWAEPELGEHDVLIDVKAAGLNFPDVLIIQGKYGPARTAVYPRWRMLRCGRGGGRQCHPLQGGR